MISAVVLAAAVAAAVFAVLVFLRRTWAWYALLVTRHRRRALLFLVAALGSPVSLVLLAASVATIAFLVRPEVRAWLIRR